VSPNRPGQDSDDRTLSPVILVDPIHDVQAGSVAAATTDLAVWCHSELPSVWGLPKLVEGRRRPD
jgi:hypothetical protein